MLQKGLTVPMIIVNVDMYTDKQSEKSAKSEEQLRYIYDKAIDDVAIDLMPFIEKTYSVKTGRGNTPYYLYMSVGDKDPWNIDCTLYYRDVLGQMGVKNQTDYVKGYGHDEPFWEQCFYNFLNKIFR